MSIKKNTLPFRFPPEMLFSRAFAGKFSGIGSILMFHRVLKSIPKHSFDITKNLEVDSKDFENFLKTCLKNGYSFISIDELHEILAKQKMAKKVLVISFDDGYIDNYSNAYPLLKQFDIPFIIYITTDFPDNKSLLWWYILVEYILQNDFVKVKEYGIEFNTKHLKDKNNCLNQLNSFFINLSREQQIRTLKEITKISVPELLSFSSNFVMSWDNIIEISQNGLCTIGAHSVTHPNLKKLDKELSYKEMIESKRILELKINKKVEHFAYPFGTFNAASVNEFKLAELAGFKTAVTTRLANIFPEHSSFLMSLPRNMIYGGFDLNRQLKLYSNGLMQVLRYKFKKIISD